MTIWIDSRAARPALLREPYRVFFPSGVVYALLIMAGWGLWLLYLGGQGPGVPVPALPPAWVHGHTLIWGVIQFFIFGFILTAIPRQCRHPDEIPPRRFLALLGGFWVAQGGIWIGALAGIPGLAAAGAGLGALLIIAAAAGLARWLPDAGNPHQPRFAVTGLALSGTAALVDAVAWALGSGQLHGWAIRAGLYAEIGLALALAHRLVPMFARNAIPGYLGAQGQSFLPWLAGGIGARLALGAIPASWAVTAGGILDLLLAAWVLRELLRWSPRTAIRQWLVGSKLVPVAWFALGFALSGLVSLGLQWPDAGRSWIHALGLGGMASLAMAFTTRVSLGHAGRALNPDRLLRTAFWALQLAAILRLLAPIWTAGPGGGMIASTHWAAWLWLAAFAVWLVRLTPLMVRHS